MRLSGDATPDICHPPASLKGHFRACEAGRTLVS